MKQIVDEKKLNKEQLEAIKYGDGPFLIIAGAGTGKTTVITERIKWIILQKKATPAEILALTFTNKAAIEMEERIDLALPIGLPQMWITTFHAFGDRVLRQEALQIGLDPGYRLMSQAEAIIIFRKNLFKFDLSYFRPLGNPVKFIEGMLQHFSRLKDEDITPIQYIDWVKSQLRNQKYEKEEIAKYKELADAYQKYEELKVKEGVMDFGDLISNSLKLFRTRENILREYQRKFKYVLIDEFQDTNFAQNELAVLLAGNRQNITVVGDDDQAIYRFRGAAVSNIIQFRQRFAKVKTVVLTKNYRSSQEILDKSYFLIQNNNPDRLEAKEKIDKKLKSARKEKGERVEFIYTDRVENEAEEIVKRITNLELKNNKEKGEKLYSWKDFVILVRANNQADPFSRALQRHGIPYQFLGPGMLFRQPEVKDLIAYLKLLFNFSDSVALFRILSMTVFDISSRDILAITIFAKNVGISLFEAVESIGAYYMSDADHWSMKKNYISFIPNLSEVTKQRLVKFVTMVLKHLDLVKKETAGQILYYFLEDAGFLQKLTEYKTIKEERIALNISKFFDKLKSYETNHEDASIAAVVDWIDMAMELGESPLAADSDWTENNAVNILTVHSSKGLEFPVVFLVNLVTNRFPTINRREQIPIPDALVKEILPEGDYHLEEERRLFYVGMTRARDKLFFTAANYYGEAKRERKISPFVTEVMGNDSMKITQSTLHAQAGNQPVSPKLSEWRKKEALPEKVIRESIKYLSYSQIDSFTTCPLQYKYRYVLKIPIPHSAAGSFGTSIHIALQKFYERAKKGENPSKAVLLSLLNEVWLPVGFGTKQYEEKMKDRGIDMLTKFYDRFYNQKVLPIELEQVFKIKLTPELKIGGKIDRIDKTEDGKLEIIDYKTGKRPTEKQINENLQMTVYALVATDPGIYNKKSEEVILSFYFLGTQEKISSTRTDEQLKTARQALIQKAEEIRTSKFDPRVGPWCKYCDFKLICEAWQ